jgi:hypothetical protein
MPKGAEINEKISLVALFQQQNYEMNPEIS